MRKICKYLFNIAKNDTDSSVYFSCTFYMPSNDVLSVDGCSLRCGVPFLRFSPIASCKFNFVLFVIPTDPNCYGSVFLREDPRCVLDLYHNSNCLRFCSKTGTNMALKPEGENTPPNYDSSLYVYEMKQK